MQPKLKGRCERVRIFLDLGLHGEVYGDLALYGRYTERRQPRLLTSESRVLLACALRSLRRLICC